MAALHIESCREMTLKLVLEPGAELKPVNARNVFDDLKTLENAQHSMPNVILWAIACRFTTF